MDNSEYHLDEAPTDYQLTDLIYAPRPQIHPALIQFASEQLQKWNESHEEIPTELVEELLMARAYLYEAHRAGVPTAIYAEQYAQAIHRLPMTFVESMTPGLMQAFPLS